MIYTLIPAYNEEESLETLIPTLAGIFEGMKENYDILVIDDGSADRTGEISSSFADTYPVRVLTHRKNQGVGAVFRTGIQEVCKSAREGDIVIVTEADGTCDPYLIPDMVAKIKSGLNVVIASRFRTGGGFRGFPLKRLIFSCGANYLFRVIFPMPGTRDYTIFYRGYRAETLLAFLDQYKDKFIEYNTFVSNAEILIKLRRLGVRVSEVPMVYRYNLKRGASKLEVRKTLMEYASFITKMIAGQRR